MGTAIESTKPNPTSYVGDLLRGLRARLSGRRGLIVLAIVTVGIGIAFSWGWLAAVGMAPILLALAPCAAMCALGMCMNKTDGKSRSGESSPADA